MQTKLHWLVSSLASCFYTLPALIEGKRLTNPVLAQGFVQSAHGLTAELKLSKIDRSRFLEQATMLAIEARDCSQLASAVLQTCGGHTDPQTHDHVSSCLSEIYQAFTSAIPDAEEELTVRGQAIRQRWETCGPGLLQAISEVTHPQVVPDQASVVLVSPVLGGGGVALLPRGTVLLEAVLTDPVETLPEVLRLAWLLSQLNLNVPVFCERIPNKRVGRAAALAMLPATLAAAESLGLARCDQPTIALALRTWHLESGLVDEVAAMLSHWWSELCEKKSRFAQALTALDRLLD